MFVMQFCHNKYLPKYIFETDKTCVKVTDESIIQRRIHVNSGIELKYNFLFNFACE